MFCGFLLIKLDLCVFIGLKYLSNVMFIFLLLWEKFFKMCLFIFFVLLYGLVVFFNFISLCNGDIWLLYIVVDDEKIKCFILYFFDSDVSVIVVFKLFW